MNITQTLPQINEVYDLQRSSFKKVGQSTAKQRIRKLKRLRDAILDRRKELQDAMWHDFRKPAGEVDLTEIYPVTSEIRFAIKNLAFWMRPKKVPTPIALLGATSKIVYEPKGMALIIAPWNYPMQLLFAPLVSAIAAGCTVMLKPSEFTTATVAVMRLVVEDVFEKDEIALVEGGIEVSQALLGMRFDHIFFTGAPSIGKIVMEAAAKNLSSVTLELGGKSPTIIDETANIKTAVPRLVWSKFINAGQICIAPDYILVHESKKDALVKALIAQIEKHYGDETSDSPDYVRIINKKHFDRLKGYLEHAVNKGGNVAYGGNLKKEDTYIEPTLVTDVPLDSHLMQDEIFGPILPIVTYSDKHEVVELINAKEKPLALYIFSQSKKNIDYFMRNTTAGGTCINICTIHVGNPHLPFGGINNSGIGKSRGHFGFIEFSNERGVMRQRTTSALEFMSPPYTNFKRRLIDLTIKYF